MSYQFYITDVFTEKKYSGNQLATIILEETTSSATLQQIAREFNFSETTFVLTPKPGATLYSTRIFTPEEELPFAGHPTLGTAYLLHKYYNPTTTELTLDLPIGRIPVTTDTNLLWMTQPSACFLETYTTEELAALLGLAQSAIRTDLPIQTVSTGLPTLIVPLKTLTALKNAAPTQNRLEDFFKQRAKRAIYAFCTDTYYPENHLNARAFVGCLGISEDPATGSSAGCLAAYLAKYTNNDIDLSLEQGFEIQRESIIKLKVTDGNIKIGGRVIEIASGKLN